MFFEHGADVEWTWVVGVEGVLEQPRYYQHSTQRGGKQMQPSLMFLFQWQWRAGACHVHKITQQCNAHLPIGIKFPLCVHASDLKKDAFAVARSALSCVAPLHDHGDITDRLPNLL